MLIVRMNERDLDPRPLSPNQIVAQNLTRARELRGWSQSETTSRLRERAGVHWSTANLSAAERSVTGQRRREFDADDLLAFARTFELPITWFLLPPDATQPLLSTQDDPYGLPPTVILDWLYRQDPNEQQRVSKLCEQIDGHTNHQHAIQEKARHYATQLAAAALAEHATTPAALRSLADAIDHALNEHPPPHSP